MVLSIIKTTTALEKLADLVPHTCTIVRDGRAHDHFSAKELVVGDLIMLTTGDRVPADVRLIDGVEMSVDESSLTGENSPVNKTGMALTVLGGSSPIGVVNGNGSGHSSPF